MPELPEVEVTRLGLSPLIGKTFESVKIYNNQLRWEIPATLNQVLSGQTVCALKRRGKYLFIQYADEHYLMIHLGMSGRLRLYPRHALPHLNKHDHVEWYFDDTVLRYHDPRRFGAVLLAQDPLENHSLLKHLGIEPLSDPRWTGEWFYAQLKNHKTAIKTILLGGKIVVGVGNIYANESLFRTRISPWTVANKLTLAQCTTLVDEIKVILTEAIQAGGSSLKDFEKSNGEKGWFQQQYFVYGRTHLPCFVCQTPIEMIVQNQRATFFCPHCQTDNLQKTLFDIPTE